ncbi:DUF2141 domain-containing protein [Iodidimonas sp. SYSU 1G8]|uniref:DUF2141 domain-containing protein n=1 Tax=Iodidimonas sp. SYSU 1G8 TaxID=3133967 RepID=UPI0031FF22AC
MLTISNARRGGLMVALGLVAVLAGSPAVHAEAEFEKAPIPEHLKGMHLSGRALELVAGRIDPSRPLGYCDPANQQPEIRVIVPNLRNGKGNLRLSLHSDDPSEWVGKKKGGKLIRFDVPAVAGRMEVCMPLPYGNGTYAVGIYHDENADGKYGFTSEGYGFSNNAKAGLFGPASHKDAAFKTHATRTDVKIDLRY